MTLYIRHKTAQKREKKTFLTMKLDNSFFFGFLIFTVHLLLLKIFNILKRERKTKIKQYQQQQQISSQESNQIPINRLRTQFLISFSRVTQRVHEVVYYVNIIY